jgi:hypothetical protein
MMRAGKDGIDGAAIRTSRTTDRTGVANRVAGGTSHRTSGTNRAARAAAVLGFLAVVGLLVLAAGCQEDTGVMPPNQTPVTYLSVLGSDLDTLSYRQILHWWGSDRDGRVEAYLVKWDSGWTPPGSAVRWLDDPSWIVTTALATYGMADSTCSNPDLPCPPMYGRHTFSVRALDDDGAADPVGRSQEFRVGNTPPVLEWSKSYARPVNSLPAVAFAWHPIDRDGPGTVHSFVYWLTREGAAPADSFFTADTLVALRPTAFGPTGDPQPGTWTLHVQAIDDSRTRSVSISHTWTVGLPAGEYLLIDNVGDVPGGENDDLFFRSMMDSVAPGNYHIMDIPAGGGFITGVEVGPFFSLFKGVLWYAGMQNPANDAVVARNLGLADRDGGLRDYLSGGGRLVLCAQNAVGDSAALSRAFQLEVLGIADHYRRSDLTSLTPEYINGNISLTPNSLVRTMIGGQPDSLKTTSSMINADFLILDPDIIPVFTVDPGYLTGTYPPSEGWRFTPDDQTTVPAVLGLLSERSGRMAVSSLIPSRAQGFRSHRRVMAALLQRVLID